MQEDNKRGLALIVDVDADAAQLLASLVVAHDCRAALAQALSGARKQASLASPELMLLDLRPPDGYGLPMFSQRSLRWNADVDAPAVVETAIEALRLGAADDQVKPITLGRLKDMLALVTRPHVAPQHPADWRAAMERDGRFGPLVGRSESMQHVYQQIARVAPTSVPVFIMGESGTGKELVARAVHDFSRRSKQPFLAVNCGAFSPSLMESEIFGHERGSFTGADRQHQGFFERAHGGTLFLDELGEMPMELQVKLLRVLETGTFMRVGSTELRQTDVRVIAATNRDPRAGGLREDLLYRLNVFPIVMPPLRDRLADMPLLTDHLLKQIGEREGRMKSVDEAARAKLLQYNWPGNVRELRNVLQRSYVMVEADTVSTDWLPADTRPIGSVQSPKSAFRGEAHDGSGTCSPPSAAQAVRTDRRRSPFGDTQISIALGTPLSDVNRRFIELTLKHFDNHKEKTAAALGVSLKTLYNKLKRYEPKAKTSD